jgi:DNA repair exonuclease SbcCD ATPase subunit
MDVKEALELSDEWIKGVTVYDGAQGWRVACATLAAAVRELEDSNQSIRETAKNHGLEEAHTIHDDPRIATLWCVRYLSEGLEAKDTRIEELTAELAAARDELERLTCKQKSWPDVYDGEGSTWRQRAEAAEKERDGLDALLCRAIDINNEMDKDRHKLRAENAALRKGEYICKKCGLRKDSTFEKGDF